VASGSGATGDSGGHFVDDCATEIDDHPAGMH